MSVDLTALLPDVDVVAGVPVEQLPAMALRLAALQAAVAARLATVPPAPQEPPLTAKQVAARLNVGVDWVRDHAAEHGLEIRLSVGTVRYDPEAVARLQRGRRARG